MLDTNICSFIIRNHPHQVLQALQEHAIDRDKIVISAITYAELRFGAMGKKASTKHNSLVDEFISRLDGVLPWDRGAAEASTTIKKLLSDIGKNIGHNDTLIAGHAVSLSCILVTNNTKEFSRVPSLQYEDWV